MCFGAEWGVGGEGRMITPGFSQSPGSLSLGFPQGVGNARFLKKGVRRTFLERVLMCRQTMKRYV